MLNPQDFVHDVFYRPKMFSADIETHRDLLLFVQGVCCGLRPHSGARDLAGFGEYLNKKLGKAPDARWPTTLLEVYGNPPVVEICESLAKLYEEWKRASGSDGPGPKR